MSKESLKKLIEQIETMRQELHQIINEKTNFTSVEVVTASKMLDALLNEYYNLLKKFDNQ